MKIRVCQITSAHKRYDARIFRKIATTLNENGFESFLLISDEMSDEVKNGVNIISTQRKYHNVFLRILFSWRLLKKKALLIDADLYQIHDPELFNLGYFLLSKGKKVIFDCHEDYRYISEKKYIPKPIRKLVLNNYLKREEKVCSTFDGVITVTPTVFNRLKPFSNKITMITNYPILVSYKQPNFLGEPRICFGGNCGWCHETLIKTLNIINEPIIYDFVTNLNDPGLNYLSKLQGWEKVQLHGYMPFEELRKVYQNSWIGFALFPYCAVVNHDEGTLGNTKIFEYMMEGIPVICSDHTIWKNIIEEENCGIAVNPYDVRGLEKAILSLIHNKELLFKFSKNARFAAETKYNWSTQIQPLLNFYFSILGVEHD